MYIFGVYCFLTFLYLCLDNIKNIVSEWDLIYLIINISFSSLLLILFIIGQIITAMRPKCVVGGKKCSPDSFLYNILIVLYLYIFTFYTFDFVYDCFVFESQNIVDLILFFVFASAFLLIAIKEIRLRYTFVSRYDPVSKRYDKNTGVAQQNNKIPVFKSDVDISIPIEENVEGLAYNPTEKNISFCMKSKDNSMDGFGIPCGATVYFSPVTDLKTGSIVAAQIENKIYIRKIRILENKMVYIEASNEEYKRFVFDDIHHVGILGVSSAVLTET